MTEDVKRAPVTPCHECPWRVSNKGRPAPQKYGHSYTRAQRLMIWSQLRDLGLQQTCHLSTADRSMFPNGNDPEWLAHGYEEIPDHAELRECGGAVAAALRELRRLVEAGSWEEYHRRRPAGLPKDVAALWVRRLEGWAGPQHPPLRPVEVDDAEIIDPPVEDGADVIALQLAPLLASVRAGIAGLAAEQESAR